MDEQVIEMLRENINSLRIEMNSGIKDLRREMLKGHEESKKDIGNVLEKFNKLDRKVLTITTVLGVAIQGAGAFIKSKLFGGHI